MYKNSGKDNVHEIIALNGGHTAETIVLGVNTGSMKLFARHFAREHFDALSSLGIDVVFYTIVMAIALRRKIRKTALAYNC